MQNPDFSFWKQCFNTFFPLKKRQMTYCKIMWILTSPKSNQFAPISTSYILEVKVKKTKNITPRWKFEMEDCLLLTYPISLFHPNTTFAEINNFLHNTSFSPNSSAWKMFQQENFWAALPGCKQERNPAHDLYRRSGVTWQLSLLLEQS